MVEETKALSAKRFQWAGLIAWYFLLFITVEILRGGLRMAWLSISFRHILLLGSIPPGLLASMRALDIWTHKLFICEIVLLLITLVSGCYIRKLLRTKMIVAVVFLALIFGPLFSGMRYGGVPNDEVRLYKTNDGQVIWVYMARYSWLGVERVYYVDKQGEPPMYHDGPITYPSVRQKMWSGDFDLGLSEEDLKKEVERAKRVLRKFGYKEFAAPANE